LAAEKAANEARLATVAAIVGTVLSLATVVGLIVTILQTRGALAEARRGNIIAHRGAARSTRQAVASAKETEAALKIARDNAEATMVAARSAEESNRIANRAMIVANRAYIVLKPERPKLEKRDDDGTEGYEFFFVGENVGNSPALGLKCLTQYRIAPRERLAAIRFEVQQDRLKTMADTGKGTTFNPRTYPVRLTDLDTVASGEKVLLLHCYVEYSDVFDGTPKRHTTQTLQVMVSKVPGTYRFQVHPFGESRAD
jgi:hypothetical protein